MTSVCFPFCEFYAFCGNIPAGAVFGQAASGPFFLRAENAPVVAGRHVFLFAKGSCEVGAVGEGQLMGDLRNAAGRVEQETAGGLDASPLVVASDA